MGNLDELIRKLCPNGVKYFYLGELEENNYIQMGRGQIISKIDLKSFPGDYPVYSSSSIGDGEIGRYGKYMFDDERITWSVDGGGKFFYRNNLKYSVTNVGGWMKVINTNMINTKFLYYTLINEWSKKAYNYIKKAHPSVIRKEYYLAIPPIEVQLKIVDILDNLTLISTRLSAKLLEELEARQEEYEYYKEKLLSFNKIDEDKITNSNKQKIKWVGLEEICDLSAGGDIKKENVREERTEKYNIPVFSNGIGENALYGYTNISKITAPSITIAARGTIGYCELRTEDFYPIVRLICVKPKTDEIDIEFLKYYIQTIKFKLPTSGIPQLTVPMLKKYKIPILPINEQRRISKILNKLDELRNNISESLNNEIEARQKQYEYYRDKLLTFKEFKANE